MKSKCLKIVLLAILLGCFSCGDPETVVTNYVHPDGSVTRIIEMRSGSGDFRQGKIQLPLDSTWSIRDSLELNEKGDSLWVRRARKHFSSFEELNAAYRNDSSDNREFRRSVSFKKEFRWFHNVYRFSENIGGSMTHGYPVSQFLNKEELTYFYAPDSYQREKQEGADSLRYKALADSVNSKSELWVLRSVLAEWISEFSGLVRDSSASDMLTDLKKNEQALLKLIRVKYNEDLDSLWEAGVVLRDFIGEENASRYKSEADTAIEHVSKKFVVDFNSYSVRFVMPGRLTATNGYPDSSKVVLWQVKSDYFLTEPYEMWAESRVANVWAWIISGLFVLFVSAGIVLRIMKKG